MKATEPYGTRLLNDGWEFCKLPPDRSLSDVQEKEWIRVTLPHDWLIWQAGDLYEDADAWYRRTLGPEETQAPVVFLCFDGVYMDCDVLLNGEILCTHRYGYTAFQAELTGKLGPGENQLTVHIRHRSPNSRWYSGSGIYRDVKLKLLPENFLVPYGLYVTAEPEEKGWRVCAEAEVRGGGTAYARLLDPDGRPAAESRGEAREGKVCLEMKIPEGRTWSPSRPELYTLEYGMGGQHEAVRIGLRTLRFDPDRGFLINGEHVKLKGVCLHHDLGALGAAFHEDAARRQLRIMKEMGVNALRTSHNPPAERMLELCDEMGILVADEIFDMWERPKTPFDYARFFPENEAEDVACWVRRDRNHACVVMWSIGNEIYDMFAGERGREITRMLRDQVRFHDPAGHAAVTFGSNYMPWEGAQKCAGEIGIPGYNYAEKLYEAHHAEHPDWVIYGSETASVLSSRGVYHFPAGKTILSDEDLQCSALGNSVSSWGARDLKKMITDDLNNPFSMGQFVWSGMDYIGEPTPYHTRSCYFGQTDTAGFPKDAYYLFQSLWTDRPMVHIGVTWDWNEGQMIDVPVTSSCPRAELRLNGKSLGVRELDRRDPEKCAAAWRIPFVKGVLEAYGLDAEGNVLCADRQETSGDTAKLRLVPEEERLPADGHSLAFIRVEALDAEGRPVANARDRICAEVSGGGMLLGMDNGDATDTDEYKGTTKRLFGGKALLIIGSTGREAPARIRVRSTGGAAAELILETEAPAQSDGRTEAFLPEIAPSPERTEIPVRRVEIIPLDGCELNGEKREAAFARKIYPENATPFGITWQVTTETGIVSPCAEAAEEGDLVRVRGLGDGNVMLRALYGNAPDHPEQISQIELRLTGLGSLEISPYQPVSLGLHDLQRGEIGAGNEHGIAFARDSGSSMAGFSKVSFGPAGSDRLTVSLFTLDDNPYELRLYDGIPGEGGRLIDRLHYQKPSRWNVYQEETYTLPERLTGVHTLCFEADRKFHFKEFSFEKQSRAFLWQPAGGADSVYGDSFRRDGDRVLEIGNNVTLTWDNMEFEDAGEKELVLEGNTPLVNNAVTLRMENEAGDAATELMIFRGGAEKRQRFRVRTPAGNVRVSFVFLPGSRFDFTGFRFEKPERGDREKDPADTEN